LPITREGEKTDLKNSPRFLPLRGFSKRSREGIFMRTKGLKQNVFRHFRPFESQVFELVFDCLFYEKFFDFLALGLLRPKNL